MEIIKEKETHLGEKTGFKMSQFSEKRINQAQSGYLINCNKADNEFNSKSSSSEDKIQNKDKSETYYEHINSQNVKNKENAENREGNQLPAISLRPGHIVKNSQTPRYRSNVSNAKVSLNQSNLRNRQNYVKNNIPTVEKKAELELKRTKYRKNVEKDYEISSEVKLPNISNRTSESDSEKSSDKPKVPANQLSLNVRNIADRDVPAKTNSPSFDKGWDDKKRYLLGQPTQHKLELCNFVERDIIGGDEVRSMCFGPTKITYLDYVASGRPIKSIENYIRQHVMPNYANTHTEVSYFAAQTTKFREEAREIIKESVHATETDAVIFCGSGSTSAIHKVIHAMDIKRSTYVLPPIVLIGPYEHHSNILPWIEIKAKVIHIQQTQEGLVDLRHLKNELKDIQDSPKRVIIGSFSAASNVTGILTNTVAVSKLIHKYGGFVFFDYACAAPYVEIDMNCTKDGPDAYKDAIFISTHKFLGGPQTPGILIAKKWVFRNQVPHGVGGGTVVFVRRQNHKYFVEPEHREEGGTPAIIESIRAGLVFKLKETFTSKFIMERETDFFKKAVSAWSDHPDILILGSVSVERLPIFSLLFRNPHTGRLLHHDFVAMLLNDLFGMQVRSGCACAALYGLELLGMAEDVAQKYEKFITESQAIIDKEILEKPVENKDKAGYEGLDNIIFKPGFVRLNLPFFISEKCINFIIKAILMIADHGWKMLPLFDFDRQTGRWWYRYDKNFQPGKSLMDMNFAKGFLDLKSTNSFDHIKESNIQPYTRFPGLDYDEILERAAYIFNDVSRPGQYDLKDQTQEYTREADELRWFMLPSEAADIIHKRKVQFVEPDNLPFLPVALSDKLKHKEKV